jgi:hypothetical protein
MAHGNYSSTANCRTKISAIFRGIFGIFRGVSKYLFIYSTILRGTPDDVLRNPGWETLTYHFLLTLIYIHTNHMTIRPEMQTGIRTICV